MKYLGDISLDGEKLGIFRRPYGHVYMADFYGTYDWFWEKLHLNPYRTIFFIFAAKER